MRSHSSATVLGSDPARKELTRTSLASDELVFDREVARRTFTALYDRFLEQHVRQIHIETEAPQWKYRPKALPVGSPAHLVWLWNAAATDLRAQSADVYHTHQLLWENRRTQLSFGESLRPTRELYTPEVLSWEREHFLAAFAKCGFGNPKRNIEWWLRRAETLWGLWEGDPFRMFQLGTIDALMAWKQRQRADPLPGIGPKIASLIAIFMEEHGMSHVPDAFPVDVHVQRLALALRVVVPTRNAPILNETLEALLRPAIVRLCAEEGWSRITLSHALWFRGNRGCTDCWKSHYAQVECPVFSECQGAYQSRSYFKMGLWLPMKGPMAKGGCAPLVPFSERSLFAQTG